ncbi:haloacid dehalogenase [Thermococcus sp.]|uniref:haloacid dehalogenase n=1 Tax=Thermococcus sp. TaxID=35749 RepID=UPI002628F8BB|nr:haloacid dehalogenase [Thermococcus sp.]
MEIEEIVEAIRAELDEKDSLREEALKLTREIVRLSGDTIKALHRGEIESAEERFRSAGEKVKELWEKLKYHPDIYYTGYVQNAHQEYVESALFLSYVTGKPYPGPNELGIPKADYALGMGDFIGELRRYFLLRLLGGDLAGAEKAYREMERTYNALMTLEYPKGLVNIRQKQDQARYVLERTLEDLTRAKLGRELEGKFEALLEKLD